VQPNQFQTSIQFYKTNNVRGTTPAKWWLSVLTLLNMFLKTDTGYSCFSCNFVSLF